MPRIALTGNVALEVLTTFFREAGYEVAAPGESLAAFKPELVFDVTAHDAELSQEVEGFKDERLAKLAGVPYSRAGMQAIVEECAFARLKGAKKILAVDADNTLWAGILSEDGQEALKPYQAFQQGLKALRDEGVLLVLLSKNDPFEFRADMALRNSDFAAVKVNWAPKAGNLLEACQELNLGVDSVVFVDDNPHERAQMAAHLPEVTVVPFPADLTKPRQFLRRLREYFFFDMGATEEDRLRAADYARQKERLMAPGATREEYLDGLGLWVKPGLAQETDLDRLAQMAGKTNQFNATTIRRTREDFAALLKDTTQRVYVFRAGDRFGEQGLVCYVIVDLKMRHLTDFVMSCRAMGRTLENFACQYIKADLGALPTIDFVATAKNHPFADFLKGGHYEEGTHYAAL